MDIRINSGLVFLSVFHNASLFVGTVLSCRGDMVVAHPFQKLLLVEIDGFALWLVVRNLHVHGELVLLRLRNAKIFSDLGGGELLFV